MFQKNLKPSSTPLNTPVGRVSCAGFPAPSTLRRAMAMIDTTKLAAVTHMVLTPPTDAMSSPPRPGPTM